MWRCPAIERGVTIYDNGIIRPCCIIDWSYSKPITEIKNPDRFSDLEHEPDVCRKCIDQEASGLPSARQYYLKLEKEKPNNNKTIQFLDIRNTNLCNARCQFCGPHHSNQWPGATLRHQDLDAYIDNIITEDLIEIYFVGGEPLISKDHANIIKKLIDRNLSKTTKLRYSTNLSVLKYKDLNFVGLWKKFGTVDLMPSADGTGKLYEDIRQGLKWDEFEKNLKILKDNQIEFRILFVLCNLNIFKLKETVDYFRSNDFKFSIEVIRGPNEFKLNTIENKQQAEQEILSCGFNDQLTQYIIKHLYH